MITNTYNTYNFCVLCGYSSYDPKDFISVEEPQCICENTDACARRQKRDAILADMEKMAQKTGLHPMDKFSRTSVVVCAFFLGLISTVGLMYITSGF